jgi:hypothetical protein
MKEVLMLMKCKECDKELPKTEEYFYPVTWYRTTGDIVHTFRKTCRQCKAPYMRKQSRVARERNYEAALLYGSRSRAKKLGLDFDLDVTDIVIPEVCPLLGIPIYMADKYAHDNSASIDRIDPSKGYTKDNIWVISRKANAIKSNATAEEILLVASGLKKLLEDR